MFYPRSTLIHVMYSGTETLACLQQWHMKVNKAYEITRNYLTAISDILFAQRIFRIFAFSCRFNKERERARINYPFCRFGFQLFTKRP